MIKYNILRSYQADTEFNEWVLLSPQKRAKKNENRKRVERDRGREEKCGT